jgi:META domain
MSLFGLVLAIGTAGMTSGADVAGSQWRPSFMSTSDLPARANIQVVFEPDGKITGNGGCNRFLAATHLWQSHQDRPAGLDQEVLSGTYPCGDRPRVANPFLMSLTLIGRL